MTGISSDVAVHGNNKSGVLSDTGRKLEGEDQEDPLASLDKKLPQERFLYSKDEFEIGKDLVDLVQYCDILADEGPTVPEQEKNQSVVVEKPQKA